MADNVIVHFDLATAPGMHRHRVSVWDDAGGVLRGPSAEVPADLSVDDGTTLVVECSTPVVTGKTHTARRDEKRWTLRAAPNASVVLELGKIRGSKVPGVSLRVEGAAHVRRDSSAA
jgi:hypothetical protein